MFEHWGPKAFVLIKLFIIGVLVAASVGSGVPAAAQGESSPTINVGLSDGFISTWGWAPFIQVTLTIDDPSTTDYIDFSEAQTADEWGDAYFEPPVYLIASGTVVTATDGTITKELEIKPLSLEIAAYSSSSAFGTGEPGAQIIVSASSDSNYATRWETIGMDGLWQVDFSVPGDEPGEEQTLVMAYGSDYYAAIVDNDNDQVSIYYRVMPFMVARLNINRVLCRGWEPGKTLTLQIDDPDTGLGIDHTLSLPVNVDLTHFSLSRAMFNLAGITTLRPGMLLTLTDGYFTRTMEVFDMTLDVIDPVNDLLSGTAEPNSLLSVYVAQLPDENPSLVWWLVSDETGNWSADLAGVYDLNELTEGVVRYFPVLGENDHTRIEFAVEVLPPVSDQDSDGLPDLDDPCPGDPTNTCNPAGSAAALVPTSGGTLITEDESVEMVVPAEALIEPTTLTITDGGTDLQLTELGAAQPAVNVQIGPDGTQFQQPVSITLSWLDDDNDGIVDGVGLNEQDLYVFKDSAAIAGPCSSTPDCDPIANVFNVQVSSLSRFVLGVLAAPQITQLTAAQEPVAVGALVNASALILDAETNDEYSVTWDWGDGSVDTSPSVGPQLSAQHTYSLPGVYTLTLTVSEAGLAPVSAVFEYIVVYDPYGGFVTGGGWIWSPAGAFIANPALEGKATFGFVSRYKKGASIPDGNTEFQFKAGGLNFRSKSYDWLVVNKSLSRAQYKGQGTIGGSLAPNGAYYKFMIWATDANPDTFRIKIWWEDGTGEQLIYDNSSEQIIGGGSIVVHN